MVALKSRPSKSSSLDGVSTDEKALQARIAALQDFLDHGEEREREAQDEMTRTLPPPSEIQDRIREKEFMLRLSRGEMANEKRSQASNGLLLVLLTLAIFALGAWIYSVVQV